MRTLRSLAQLALVTLVAAAAPGCGGGSSRPATLDGGLCSTITFACGSTADCCTGLTCKGGVCAVGSSGNGNPDMAMSGGNPPAGTGCSGILACIGNCAATDMTCPANCYKAGTTSAQKLFATYVVCDFGDMKSMTKGACDDWGGGPCDTAAKGYVQATCDACLMNAEGMGGTCFDSSQACFADCTSTPDCAGLTCTDAKGNQAACTCLMNQCQ